MASTTCDRLLVLCFCVGLFDVNGWGLLFGRMLCFGRLLFGRMLCLGRLLLCCKLCLGWLLLCPWQEKHI